MKTSKIRRVVTIASALGGLALAGTDAAADGMQPGLWETRGQSTMVGAPFTPPIDVKRCVTPEQAANRDVKTGSGRGCQMHNVQQSANGMSGDMVCSGGFNGSGHFHTEFSDPKHYTGGMEISGSANGHPIQMKQTYSGSWISDSCP